LKIEVINALITVMSSNVILDLVGLLLKCSFASLIFCGNVCSYIFIYCTLIAVFGRIKIHIYIYRPIDIILTIVTLINFNPKYFNNLKSFNVRWNGRRSSHCNFTRRVYFRTR